MSNPDELRKARSSYSVAFFNYIKIIAKKPTWTIMFFEGEDIKYYGPRINTLNPDLNWASVNCGGRYQALKIYELISKHETYSKSSVAFFIDKDFSISPPASDKERIYITPCYSIENLYVSVSAFSAILEGEYKLPRLPDECGHHEKCLDVFSKRLDEYLESIKTLNAWVYSHRKNEHDLQTGRLLNIDLISLSKLVTVEVDSITSHYSIQDLERESGQPSVATNEELIRIIQSYENIDKRTEFRGKFISYFMRKFTSELSICSKNCSHELFPEARKVPLQVSEKNFLSDLSQYAETPSCLRNFIDSILPQATIGL